MFSLRNALDLLTARLNELVTVAVEFNAEPARQHDPRVSIAAVYMPELSLTAQSISYSRDLAATVRIEYAAPSFGHAYDFVDAVLEALANIDSNSLNVSQDSTVTIEQELEMETQPVVVAIELSINLTGD